MRATFNGKAQIVVGDATSHGGVVLSGSPSYFWHGIPVVRQGDPVYCPRCRPHLFEVAEGSPYCTDGAARLPLAMEGHRTTCGALLQAQAAPASARGAAIAAAGGAPHDAGLGFDLVFRLQDRRTGHAKANLPYRIVLDNGDVIDGTTDSSGCTLRVYADRPMNAVLTAPYYGYCESGADAAPRPDPCDC
jgi:uncharacterized Zn-binding protein involved in type VI secretion